MWVPRHPHVTNTRATDVLPRASRVALDVQHLHNDYLMPNDPTVATLL
jgi:hypothetical protein